MTTDFPSFNFGVAISRFRTTTRVPGSDLTAAGNLKDVLRGFALLYSSYALVYSSILLERFDLICSYQSLTTG
jgi:hypothetical protein